MIDTQYQRALNILKRHKESLTKLASFLLEKEVIFSEDLEKIFGKREFKKAPVHTNNNTITPDKPQTKVKSSKPKATRSTKTSKGQVNTKKSA